MIELYDFAKRLMLLKGGQKAYWLVSDFAVCLSNAGFAQKLSLFFTACMHIITYALLNRVYSNWWHCITDAVCCITIAAKFALSLLLCVAYTQ